MRIVAVVVGRLSIRFDAAPHEGAGVERVKVLCAVYDAFTQGDCSLQGWLGGVLPSRSRDSVAPWSAHCIVEQDAGKAVVEVDGPISHWCELGQGLLHQFSPRDPVRIGCGVGVAEKVRGHAGAIILTFG